MVLRDESGYRRRARVHRALAWSLQDLMWKARRCRGHVSSEEPKLGSGTLKLGRLAQVWIRQTLTAVWETQASSGKVKNFGGDGVGILDTSEFGVCPLHFVATARSAAVSIAVLAPLNRTHIGRTMPTV
jgi:hypothetical protein